MSWTTTADLRAQVQKLWDREWLLAGLLVSEQAETPNFPKRLAFKGPSSTELSEQFARVQDWIAELRTLPRVRIEWRDVKHRIIGSNRIPDAVWLDSADDALALIGKQAQARRFRELADLTAAQQPALMPWLAGHPLSVLELSADWPRLLQVVGWMQAHPQPGIYLRQMDLPGVDSKFVEAHRGVLAALLDLALPAEAVASTFKGAGAFNRRYGFLDEALRVRFRILDPALALMPGGGDQDITLRHDAFAQLRLPARRVFITENKTNFLAFPSCEASLVIWGEGYGFEMLAAAQWLRQCAIHYWGDIDTHGFAILSQLRTRLPQTQSFLMDAETLLGHRTLWGSEPAPELRDLPCLTEQEASLFDALRDNRFGPKLRLEQERIGFEWVKVRLSALVSPPESLNL